MRVPFKYAGGGFVRVRAHDREGAEFIGDVADSACGNLLRAAQWPAHRDDGGLMLLGPSLPGRHALLLLRLALGRRQRIPVFKSVLAAEENREIGSGWLHRGLSVVRRGIRLLIIRRSRRPEIDNRGNLRWPLAGRRRSELTASPAEG